MDNTFLVYAILSCIFLDYSKDQKKRIIYWSLLIQLIKTILNYWVSNVFDDFINIIFIVLSWGPYFFGFETP